MADYSIRFYQRLSSARTQSEIFECVKIATASSDPAVLNALVSCIFCSKEHRRAISRCITKWLRARAVPALLSNLSSLPPDKRIRQLMLLCKVGHAGALRLLAEAAGELAEMLPSLKEALEDFFANNSSQMKESLRHLIVSGEPTHIVFAAPWYMKYDPVLTCARLQEVCQDSQSCIGMRQKALVLLSSHDPAASLAVLASSADDFGFESSLKALQHAFSAEDYNPLRGIVEAIFAGGDKRGTRLAAAVVLAQEGNREAATELHKWVIAQLSEVGGSNFDPKAPNLALVRSAGVALARADDKEWVGVLASVQQPESFREFCRRILYAARHPAGLTLLLNDIRGAEHVNDMFRPVVIALTTYRETAAQIAGLVLAAQDERLLRRAQEIASEVWPGKTLEDIAHERETTLTQGAGVEALQTPPQRRERTAMLLERDVALPLLVKRLEGHVCQVCGRCLRNARNGKPYAEVHHVQPLGHEGIDGVENMLCLCPLCHRLLHLGVVGVDGSLGLHLAEGCGEKVLGKLRVEPRRKLSASSLRYHWATFFAAPTDSCFSDEDGEEG